MEINHGKFKLELNRFVRTVQCNRGFTLIELLVVAVILGVLSAMALSAFSTFREKAKVARCSEELRTLEREIIAYSTDKVFTGLADIGRQDLKDPWGNNYVYVAAPAAGLPQPRYFATDVEIPPLNTDFYLYSKGADGRTADRISGPDTDDDVIRANDGAFCTVAIKYGLP